MRIGVTQAEEGIQEENNGMVGKAGEYVPSSPRFTGSESVSFIHDKKINGDIVVHLWSHEGEDKIESEVRDEMMGVFHLCSHEGEDGD